MRNRQLLIIMFVSCKSLFLKGINMKSKIRPVLSVLLAAALLLCCAGCGKAPEAETPAAAEEAPPEYKYVSESLFTVENTRENAPAVEPAFFTDSGYYAIGGRITGKHIPEGAAEEHEGQFDTVTPCLSFVSMDGTVKELPAYKPLTSENSDNEAQRDYTASTSLEKLFLRTDGNLETVEELYVSWCEAGPDVRYGSEDYYAAMNSEEACYIRVLDTEGAEISRARLNTDSLDDLSFYSSAPDSEGNLLVFAGEGLIAFRDSGEEAYRIPLDGYAYVYSISALKDGRTAALIYDYTSNQLLLRTVDPSAGAFGPDSWKLNYNVDTLVPGAGDYDLYFNSGSGFYGYSLETGTAEKLFNWIDCDISSAALNCFHIREDGAVLAISYSYNEKAKSQTSETVCVRAVPYSPAEEKTHLRLATLYADSNLTDEVIRFNRTHDSVRIDLADYSEYNTEDDYSAGVTKLLTEILAGDVPDIIDMSSDMPYFRFTAKGLLEDLYPYIDADEELSREDFFPNVFGALEADGGLYMACSGFAVYTAVGSSSVVGEGPGITYDKYYEALASMPEGCEGFDFGCNRESMLQISLALDLTDYMDWKTGSCNFDCPEFIALLNYLKSFPARDKVDDMEYSAEETADVRIAEGRQMLAVAMFSSVDYIISNYDTLFGGQASLVGFPTNHGIGNMIAIASGLSMSSACADRGAAWEFIRTYLTEDFQQNGYYLPTNINVFNESLAEAMEPKYETDANGNYRLDENGERIPVCIGSYYDDAGEHKVYSMSEAQGQMLKQAIADSSRIMNFDESIIDIVLEGSQAFFAGQKTAEETAKLIQSKANIYINEQR